MQKHAVAPWDLKQKASAVLEFVVIVPVGVSLEDALAPAYWRNAWKVLDNKKFAEVTLIADDGSFDVTARLMRISETEVEWRVLREWEPKRAPGRKPSVPEGYVVEHLAGDGWRAVAPDGAILVTKKPTEADALTVAIAHSKKAAA